MQAPVSVASRNDHRADCERRHASRIGPRALTAAAVATAALGFGVLSGPTRPTRAGDEDKAASAAVQASRQDFIRETQRKLKEEDDRLIVIAKQLLAEPDAPGSIADQIVNMRITVKSAEANYLNAKLKREVAEIAIKEYKDGVYVQDLQTVEGEIRLARSSLQRGRDLIEVAKERQARIKEVADENTAYGRNINYGYEDRIVSAELELEQRKYALEAAESKKKVLLEYTREKTIRDLESDVKKAHSDELAKLATWELEKAKLETMQRALKAPWPASAIGKRFLVVVDRAIPIEEQAHAKLDQLAKASDSGESLQKDIRELTNELGAIIEEAEAARSAGEFVRLKSWIRRATRR